MKDKKIIIENVRDFDADHIFDCGQCFRWRKQSDGSWSGIAEDRIANVKFTPTEAKSQTIFGQVEIREFSTNKGSKEFWENYLDLNRDYGEIKKKLTRGDSVMKQAVKSGQGIRILNQDLWETIVAFIISQNNNIPRIKGCIERLADVAGNKIEIGFDEDFDAAFGTENLILNTIPGPEKLASLEIEDLKEVRLGYRAKYLIRAGREVLERGLPTTYDEVLALTGIGPKVANCIGLFGLHETSSFPIDVWIKRVMHELYGFDEEDKKAMAEYAKEHFGEYSGIAQQYLFYYIREMSKNSNK